MRACVNAYTQINIYTHIPIELYRFMYRTILFMLTGQKKLIINKV